MMRVSLWRCFLVLMTMGSGCFVDRSGIEGSANGGPRKLCPEPCEHGGVCVGGECFCALVDYGGPTCGDPIDDCADVDCLSGVCLDRVRDYSCDCDQGWTIDTSGICAVEILSCMTPNACIQGTCDDSSGEVLCECYPGFQGTNCNVPISCGSPPGPPPNAVIGEITGTEFGDVITFDCLPGFGTDSVALACLTDGKWEVPNLVCEPLDCGVPQMPVFGVPARWSIPNGTGLGALAMYWCDPGSTILGPSTRVCQADGEWSGMAPVCVVDGACETDPCPFGSML